MNKDKILREHLLNLLKGGNAHMTFKDMTENFPAAKMNTVFPNGTYTPWHLLEHIRRAQNDILEFITNPNYTYKEWPKDYWPAKEEKATIKTWRETVELFQEDLRSLEKIVKDTKTDLYKKIPWGEGQTILREILLTCDHSAYHIGEFAIMRQTMKTWGKGH
jgi:DinB superfamily